MQFSKISHEEILAKKPSIDELKSRQRMPISAILENVRSLHNVGALFRTSDAVMLNKLYLCGYTGCPPRKEISKTALGAEETVPWEQVSDTVALIRDLKSQGVQIVALELTHSSVSYSQATFNYPCCLVVGNEISGISDEVMAEVDLAIDIPMLGRANSLNVATAYGIALYEMLNKYSQVDNPYRS